MEKGKVVRQAAVAGSFYPGSSRELRQLVESCFTSSLGPGALPQVAVSGPRQIIGLICPHAGIIYSGPAAARGFFQVASDGKPEHVIILGPNHRGVGTSLAVSTAAEWETPLGKVKVDEVGARNLLAESTKLKKDDAAHAYEHSLEIQLPFLQYLYGDEFNILPVCMGSQDLATSQEVGKAIARAFSPQDTLIIASSDFTHYESHSSAKKKDGIALQAIERLDAEGLVAAIDRYDITMCGPGPIIAMMTACKQWGVAGVNVLGYTTSGDVTGDYSHVVGYASVEVRLKKR